MKIEYMRNMQFGYMRIELDKPLSKTDKAMLEQNRIEGLLPVRWQQENDKYLLRYDITGKQALDSVLENAMADEKLLKSLLVGIYVAVKQLEKYLLPQEGLLLLPETIFVDHKTETVHFCYFPENEETLQVRFVKLMEYMLAKTDHKNISAVKLSYGVYEELQQPSFCMDNLFMYLQGECEGDCEQLEAEKEEWEEKPDIPLESEHRKIQLEKCISEKEWKERFMAWIKGKVEKISKSKIRGSYINNKIETVIYEADSVQDIDCATTVLGAGTDIEGILRYEGTGAIQDIVITKVPFIIGSASDCDGIIRHPNVSRKHAKITYRDGTYFLEDLNSTNGTRVNGGLLSYKTKVSLKKNTNIYFANEPFCFL